jgi:hypothetical protein
MIRIVAIAMLAFRLLAITMGEAGNSAPIRVEQQKTPPGVSISPGSIDFGDQVAKRTSAPRRITVTNTGGKKLYINSAVIGGDDLQDFVMSGDTCTGATVASQKSCVIDVRFNPKRTGGKKATLTLTDNAGDSPQTVTLTGNGINSVDEPPRGAPVLR